MNSIAVPLTKASQKTVTLKALLFISATKILLHLIVNLTSAYGYFRDEFYYIACAERLAWGYVDQSPFSLAMLKLSNLVLGESLWAIRILPSLAGAGVIFITGLIVIKLGGRLFEVVLAGIAVFIA